MHSLGIHRLCCGLLLALICIGTAMGQGHLYVKAAPSGPAVSTTSTAWVDVPDLSLTLVQPSQGHVSIGFAAEAYTSSNRRMFARVLIDGQPAAPSDVVFKRGEFTGTHSFYFSALLSAGSHLIKVQYMVDSGGEAYLGDRTLSVVSSPAFVATIAPASGPDVTTTSSSWTDIPGFPSNVDLPAAGDIVVTLSAEAETSNGRMFVRILVDSAAPGSPSDAVFAVGGYTGTRTMTYIAKNLTAGNHTIRAQWLVDGSTTGYLGDRTMTVAYSNPVTLLQGQGITSVSAPSGPWVTTTASAFSDIPDLSAQVVIPTNGTLAVSFAGENFTSADRMFVRALIDGQTMEPSDAVFSRGGFSGSVGYQFVKSNLSAGPATVKMQWLVDPGGTANLGDRNMTIVSFAGTSSGGCTADATTMCLNQARFRIRVNWRNYNNGNTGAGQAVPLTADSGYFWFFNSDNIELVIKVLDARVINGRFWVMYGALSDVEYTITVTDTQSGAVKTYYNPPRTLASAADVNAF